MMQIAVKTRKRCAPPDREDFARPPEEEAGDSENRQPDCAPGDDFASNYAGKQLRMEQSYFPGQMVTLGSCSEDVSGVRIDIEVFAFTSSRRVEMKESTGCDPLRKNDLSDKVPGESPLKAVAQSIQWNWLSLRPHMVHPRIQR